MNFFFRRLFSTGTHIAMPKMLIRSITLVNSIGLIAAIICAVYLFYMLNNGWSISDVTVAITVLCLGSIPFLNRWGQINFSRVLLSLTIPLAAMFLLMVGRMQDPERFDYIRSPGIFSVLLATCVLPVMIFSRGERLLMAICQGFNLLLFASADILLRYFSKLHQLPTLQQYFSANLALLLAYLLLTGSVASLKEIIDDFESSNESLIDALNKKNIELEATNRELHELNKNIETQNEEMQAQSEELIQSQESLMIANTEIERQKGEVEKSLDEKSKDLLYTNQHLVTQNNELQQFSYTVSHNLRGPVASILGLISIHKLAETEEDKSRILEMLKNATLSLESIIVDLNRIIDIRFDKFSVYEEVTFETELLLIRQSLSSFLEKNEVTIEEDFQYPQIRSIKAYINSILYNLLSNAIQYRSPLRKPIIKISTFVQQNQVILNVTDNGLGIDLNRFQGDLFKLYKRFHISSPGGKGLGLYLIKQQVEKLNGRIEVESKPDAGATFRVYLPVKG
jgi:signal transduction histidine kinase